MHTKFWVRIGPRCPRRSCRVAKPRYSSRPDSWPNNIGYNFPQTIADQDHRYNDLTKSRPIHHDSMYGFGMTPAIIVSKMASIVLLSHVAIIPIFMRFPRQYSALSSGRFAGSKSQGAGRLAPAASRRGFGFAQLFFSMMSIHAPPPEMFMQECRFLSFTTKCWSCHSGEPPWGISWTTTLKMTLGDH